MKKVRFGFTVLVILAFSLISCSSEGDIKQILGKTAIAPVFLDCRPVSPTEIAFTFSRPVRVLSLNFDTQLETKSIGEGEEVRISFTRPLEEGKKITADILVEDADRNSLNVIVPFRARNDRTPALVFNEIRTDYSNPRVEFVEFLALGPGNLGAMRLFIAHQSLDVPVYEFQPIEVKGGEYIVLHLRTVEEGCVDETGTDLTLSRGANASDTARDLWVPGNRKIIHRTNGLWLLDQDDRIIDAILMSENPDTDAANKTFAAAAEFLGRENAWLPRSGPRPHDGWVPDPASAVHTRGTTNTRTINRDESLPPERRAGNWYIAATGSASPGGPNSTRRHVVN